MGRHISFAIVVAFVSLGADCEPTPQAGDPLAGLTPDERADFDRGRAIFMRTFTVESGLGPLFNAESCAECHEDPVVGGAGDENELHASRVMDALAELVSEDTAPPQQQHAAAACDLLFALGGPVYQQRVTPALGDALGIDREPVPAGAETAVRSSPDVFGFGLLDAVPDSTILALADPDDANGDGISGRPNRFLDGRVGRFGRKAFVPTLGEFNAGAFQIEIGVTVPAVPDEGTVGGQPLPPGVDPLPEPELDAESVRLANAFVRLLAPPPPCKPTSASARRGKVLFERTGCVACHVPSLRTGASDVGALAHRSVAAYTDLLLHDMGADLGDICFGDATASEFRTEPLMGLRFATRFLHDGRATTIEDAIRLHGGEGRASRDAFAALSTRDRAALLAFLRTL